MGRWRRVTLGKLDINPTAEGRAGVCYMSPPEMPSRLCAGAPRCCGFYLRVFITVTGLSLVVRERRGVGGSDGEPAKS